ncbi:hypothetical protein DVS77_23300 [Mycolicibacterium moriokaense]|nr:hypothetical protein DVS77_23300 [Mycolicibacterium moriokaense]
MTTKPAILADYLAKIWLNMIERNGAIAEEALRKTRAGAYGFDDYAQSVLEVVDGNLSDAFVVAETAAAGPAFTVAPSLVRSSAYPITHTGCQVQVTLTSPLSRGFGDKIDPNRVSFESVSGEDKTQCPTGLLAAGSEKFHVVVDRTNLQSGSYVASAVVTPVTEDADDADKITMDVTIDL